MAGRKRRCWNCHKAPGNRTGRVVNAYVRLGNPSRWIRVGEVCVDCGHFDLANWQHPQRPAAPTLRPAGRSVDTASRPQSSTQRSRPTPTKKARRR